MIEATDDWLIDDPNSGQEYDSLFDDTDDDNESQHIAASSESQPRPTESGLTFVRYVDWGSGRLSHTEPTIHYNVEWKLSVKNRGQAGESELQIVISPQEFWRYILRSKIQNACVDKPWKEQKTKVILSVTDRKTAKITKEFPKLDVDWTFIAERLQEWSKFLNDGKTITITVTFYFDSLDTGKLGRGGATANQEADLEARTARLGRGAYVRRAYEFVRCPGPPCTKGSDHCWLSEGRHYPLRPHHVRMLADYLQEGKPLNGHDDVPIEFRRLVMDDQREQEERQQKERDRAQGHKRRRGESHMPLDLMTVGPYHRDSPEMVFPSSPLDLGLSTEEAIKAYSIWHRARASSEQKRHYEDIEDLTLASCMSLDMLASNQNTMFHFFSGKGIPAGIAWSYVCYVGFYLKQHQRAQSV